MNWILITSCWARHLPQQISFTNGLFSPLMDTHPRTNCWSRSLAHSLQTQIQSLEQESERGVTPWKTAACFVIWQTLAHPWNAEGSQRKEVCQRGACDIFGRDVLTTCRCVFVSMMMFTATWRRIATKLGYDELLSWREKWIQQRSNVWDLRYCVLLEVTFRC